jgi:hypothetical protein
MGVTGEVMTSAICIKNCGSDIRGGDRGSNDICHMYKELRQ